MVCTPYSAVPAMDLVEYALHRDTRSDLEVELAQRLAQALDMLVQNEMFHPEPVKHIHDA